jgi:hypothetical protein
MPGGSKKGGGLKSSPVYKMKGSPMQRNFGEWFKTTKLGKDLKKLGTKMQDTAANVRHSTPESRSKTVSKGFTTSAEKRSEASKKRSKQLQRFFIPKNKNK